MQLKTRQKILGIVIIVALVVIFFPFSFGHSGGLGVPVVRERLPKPPAVPNIELPAPAKIVYEPISEDQNSQVVALVPTTPPPVTATAPIPTATTTTPSSETTAPATSPVATPVAAVQETPPVSASPPAAPAPTAISAPVVSTTTPPMVQPTVVTHAPVAAPVKKAKAEKIPALPAGDIRPEVNSNNYVPAQMGKPHAALDETHAWVVQLGSFQEVSQAMDVINRLKKKGYTAFMGTGTVQGQTWYRVYVGPLSTASEAATEVLQLKTEEHLSGFVHTYEK